MSRLLVPGTLLTKICVCVVRGAMPLVPRLRDGYSTADTNDAPSLVELARRELIYMLGIVEPGANL